MIILSNRNIKIIKPSKSLNYKDLDLYKIIKVYNNFAYKLKLFLFIKRIYSIFHL